MTLLIGMIPSLEKSVTFKAIRHIFMNSVQIEVKFYLVKDAVKNNCMKMCQLPYEPSLTTQYGKHCFRLCGTHNKISIYVLKSEINLQ